MKRVLLLAMLLAASPGGAQQPPPHWDRFGFEPRAAGAAPFMDVPEVALSRSERERLLRGEPVARLIEAPEGSKVGYLRFFAPFDPVTAWMVVTDYEHYDLEDPLFEPSGSLTETRRTLLPNAFENNVCVEEGRHRVAQLMVVPWIRPRRLCLVWAFRNDAFPWEAHLNLAGERRAVPGPGEQHQQVRVCDLRVAKGAEGPEEVVRVEHALRGEDARPSGAVSDHQGSAHCERDPGDRSHAAGRSGHHGRAHACRSDETPVRWPYPGGTPMYIDDIRRTLAVHKPILAERFKVKEIGVFGSFARGEQDQESDIDVLVSFFEPVGFFAFLDLEEYLEGILGQKVDVVTRRALKPGIGRNILRDLVTV